AVLSRSDRSAQVCWYLRIKLVLPGLHSSPIARPLERGSSLPGQTLQAALSLSEEERRTVSFRLISTAGQLSCLTVRPPALGSSLRGAQLAHSLQRERLQVFRVWSGPMNSTDPQSAQLTGATISVAAAGATTNFRTTPAVLRT